MPIFQLRLLQSQRHQHHPRHQQQTAAHLQVGVCSVELQRHHQQQRRLRSHRQRRSSLGSEPLRQLRQVHSQQPKRLRLELHQ